MLTADLIRATRRKGSITPRFIDPERGELLEVAAGLIDVFEGAAAATPPWTRSRIDEAIADLVSELTDPLLFRGLCKLLFDRSQLETAAEIDPVDVRRLVFESAAKTAVRRVPGRDWASLRAEIIARSGAELAMQPEAIEESLYADLDANQRLEGFKRISARALLDRYNLALAQAVLIRATRMVIGLPPAKVGAYRQLFRALKFHQLIHVVRRGGEGDYTIEVDGPLSMFSSANRYGVAMARFLPTLALLDQWHLAAEVLWGKARDACLFNLDHTRGLRSHIKRRGQYVTSEQEWLEERFEKKPGAWYMSRAAEIIQTERGEVVVPDLRFEHAGSGETAYLEIIGFWRRGSLQKRLEQLDDPSLSRLVLAVSRRLAGDRGAEKLEHPRVVWFKQVINAKEVRKRLDGLLHPS